ncbi:MAG: hypothetical protein IJ532_08985 [Alphaproteobacteria bacterium]|nr:hypothetical protein [Alphaproteobacteria bacterium]
MNRPPLRSPLHLSWLEKYEKSLKNMESASQKGNGILIEVAAQHPLREGKFPDEEFAARLNLGLKIYNELSAQENVKFYIPGSRHQENGKADIVSLSTAGKNYLISQGIPAENIYADDANNEIMGEKGVYNSTDECYVSCKLFEKHNFKKLHLICSPNQMMRKMLCYINFGYFPNIHTAAIDRMYHNPINEIFECIPKVLENNQKEEDVTRDARRVK